MFQINLEVYFWSRPKVYPCIYILPLEIKKLGHFSVFWWPHHPITWRKGIIFGLLETTNDILGLGKVSFHSVESPTRIGLTRPMGTKHYNMLIYYEGLPPINSHNLLKMR